MQSLTIEPTNIGAILIAEGWVTVQSFEVVTLALPGGTSWKGCIRFRDSQGREAFLPGSAIQGVVAKRHVEAPEEAAAREAEQREAEAQLFRSIYRTDRETYDRLSAEQGGFCATCRTRLGDSPWSHYVKDDDGERIACSTCTPYRHRS